MHIFCVGNACFCVFSIKVDPGRLSTPTTDNEANNGKSTHNKFFTFGTLYTVKPDTLVKLKKIVLLITLNFLGINNSVL